MIITGIIEYQLQNVAKRRGCRPDECDIKDLYVSAETQVEQLQTMYYQGLKRLKEKKDVS